MMSQEQLQTVHAGLADLRTISGDLRSLGRAFEMTGNDAMGLRMASLATEIAMIERWIDGAVGQSIADDAQAASRDLFNTIHMALVPPIAGARR